MIRISALVLGKVSITNFIRNEFIDYNISNDFRSLPNVMDGLKESQRKVLYSIFLKKLDHNKQSMKVSRLSGFVSENTSYHHGEAILGQTIKGMAQSFVGANNIPIILDDCIGFGSRIDDSGADPRYIFTKMTPLTRLIFRVEDDDLLEYLEDDGDKIEPNYYVPIIPMVLINGVTSIASGWSCNVPLFNVIDVLRQVRKWIGKEEIEEIHPWYRGFKGTIIKDDDRYIARGVLTKNRDEYKITELSIDYSFVKYKEKVIDPLWTDGFIDNVKYGGDDENIEISFLAGITPSKEPFLPDKSNMKLKTYLHTSNMMMFSSEGKIKKYSIRDIIEEFCEVRLRMYDKRKDSILEKLNQLLMNNRNKLHFITEIIDGTLTIKNKDEDKLVYELEEKKYDKINDGFKYLLDLPIRTMTDKKLNEIRTKIAELEQKIKEETETTPADKWLNELNEFENAYHLKYSE